MASSHPLQSGIGAPPPLDARFQLNALPPGTCFADLGALQKWIEEGTIAAQIKGTGVLFASAGTVSNATLADRNYPRVVFAESGAYIGIMLYIPEIQAWSLPAIPGQLMVVYRNEDTIAEDMAKKFLTGWFVCDGSRVGVPDLTPNAQSITVTTTIAEVEHEGTGTFTPEGNGWFLGTALGPWDIYTVMKLA